MKTSEMISKIKSSSLKKGREEEFLNCVLNKMENTNHLSIKNLPKVIIKADLVNLTNLTENSEGIMLDNIIFPKCFSELYESVIDEYFCQEEMELENEDLEDRSFCVDSNNGKLSILYPKLKCNNGKYLDGNYKVCISFGSILENKFLKDIFKINFYVHSLEKLEEKENKIEKSIIDDFEY